MKSREAAQRYAQALFSLATEHKRAEEILNEVREMNDAINGDPDLKDFFSAPVVKAEEQKQALQGLFAKKKMTEEVRSILMLLAEKRRLPLFSQIASELQHAVDASKGVARGHVRSAATLSLDDRKKLEMTISRHTGQKAVLEYNEDKSLLGGLVAQVGSFTFDDSLETQLRLLRDGLKRRRAN